MDLTDRRTGREPSARLGQVGDDAIDILLHPLRTHQVAPCIFMVLVRNAGDPQCPCEGSLGRQNMTLIQVNSIRFHR